MQITKEQFVDWKNHPVTEIILSTLKSQRKRLMEDLAMGATLYSENTGQQTAHMVGEIAGMNIFLEIDYDDKEKGEG